MVSSLSLIVHSHMRLRLSVVQDYCTFEKFPVIWPRLKVAARIATGLSVWGCTSSTPTTSVSRERARSRVHEADNGQD